MHTQLPSRTGRKVGLRGGVDGPFRRSCVAALLWMLACYAATAAAAETWTRQVVDIAVAPGLRVTAINVPTATASPAPRTLSEQASTPEPIPIAGFLPYLAVALSNKAQPGEFQYAHVLTTSVLGTPLHAPLDQGYAIGILDTGGTVHLAGHCDRSALGLTAAWFTGNTVPLGGAGGQIDADVTQPLGLFAAGIQV